MSSELQLEQLQQLNDTLSNKESYYLTFTFNDTTHTARFDNPIKLNSDRKYECALQYFSTSNYLINITKDNNRFIYTMDANTLPKPTWIILELETGAYEIKTMNEEIQRMMIEKGHCDKTKENAPYINIGVNLSTFKSFIDITNPTYKVDFKQAKTFRHMLGFGSKILSKGHNLSDSTIQVTNTGAIMITCDLISGSYHNGKEKNILYSFPSMLVPSGYKLNVIPSALMYLPVHRSVISSITFQITNDEFEKIDLKGEKIAMALRIQQV
jgi:hypothetical protein